MVWNNAATKTSVPPSIIVARARRCNSSHKCKLQLFARLYVVPFDWLTNLRPHHTPRFHPRHIRITCLSKGRCINVASVLARRKNGVDLSKDQIQELWYHIANMTQSPYEPFLRKMTVLQRLKDQILLEVSPFEITHVMSYVFKRIIKAFGDSGT